MFDQMMGQSRRMRYAAAPQYGTIAFMGQQSGRVYNVDLYLGDVVDSLGNFDGGGGASATSPDSFTAPEDLLLSDFSIVTGMTDTTKIQILRGNQPTGDFLRYTQHLTTSPTRSPLRLGFSRGTQIRVIQKA